MKTKTVHNSLAVFLSLLLLVTAAVPITASAATVPSKVRAVKAAQITPTSVTFAWSKASGAKRYQIVYKDKSSKKYTAKYVSGTSKKLTGLVSSHTYYFKVRALNGKGYGGFSPVKAVRTPTKYYTVRLKQPKHGDYMYIASGSKKYKTGKKFLAGTKLKVVSSGDYGRVEQKAYLVEVKKLYKNGKQIPSKYIQKKVTGFTSLSYSFRVSGNVTFSGKSVVRTPTKQDRKNIEKWVEKQNGKDTDYETTYTLAGVTFRYIHRDHLYDDNDVDVKKADKNLVGAFRDVIVSDDNPIRAAQPYVYKQDVPVVTQAIYDLTLDRFVTSDDYFYSNHSYELRDIPPEDL